MINSSYNSVFDIQVFHDFFMDNSCTCLTYKLGSNSKSLGNRFGYKMSFISNGFDFLSEMSGTLKEHIQYLKTVTSSHYFDFVAFATNQNFYSFTDFPIDWKGAITFNSEATSNIIKSNAIVLSPILETPNTSTILFNLKIHFDDVLKCHESFGRAKFQIHFKSRATQWQYYIINRSSMVLKNPEIASTSNINFAKNENVKLPNGERALLFYSDENISLSELPKQKFSLIEKSNATLNAPNKIMNRTKTVLSGLPNPSPTKLRLKVTNNQHMVVSPMYLYI